MQNGFKKAVKLANFSLQNISAYKKFVRLQGYRSKAVKTEADFLSLPITDKKRYFYESELTGLFSEHRLPKMAYASSGSSGSPTYWFRDERQEAVGGVIHEKIFKDIFNIKKQDPTLVIICFSMGVWVAGNYTLSCCQWVSKQGYNLTTITPGIEKHDIFHILKKLAPHFKNVILAGYPSFVMDIIHEVKEKNIPLPKDLKIFTAGDSFSENWRKSVCEILGSKTKPESIISIYGSADAGIVGFETPLSIFLKKAAVENNSLYRELFGDIDKEPALVQFDHKYIYIESIKNELVLTCDTAAPLIRYNIHDIGEVVEFEAIEKLLQKYNLYAECKKTGLLTWKMPFVIKKGRSDVAVTFYALNIYPEHIQAGLSDKKIHEMVSGNFRAYNQTIKNHSQEQLCLEIELAEKKTPSPKALKKITKSIVENLLKINTEFRKLHASIGNRAMPQIKLFKSFEGATQSGHKVLVGSKDKKPKIFE